MPRQKDERTNIQRSRKPILKAVENSADNFDTSCSLVLGITYLPRSVSELLSRIFNMKHLVSTLLKMFPMLRKNSAYKTQQHVIYEACYSIEGEFIEK